MKCEILLIYLILILSVLFTYNNCLKANVKWKLISLDYKDTTLKIIMIDEMDIKEIKGLLEIADKSSKNKKIADVEKYSTMFGKNDVICVSYSVLYWFSATTKRERRKISTGGGLLAGLWEVKFNDKTKSTEFKKMDLETFYSPNILLPGSNPKVKIYEGDDYPNTHANVEMFGGNVYGNYPGSKVIFGLEYAADVKLHPNSGKDILSVDRGPFSADDGVFVIFTGVLGNSGTDLGIETLIDTDPRPGVKGKTEYTLTYRIPAYRTDFIQEINLKAVENNFGPISNAFVSMHLAGNEGLDMSYASNPELGVRDSLDSSPLNDKSVNKYFKNSCVKNIFFYDVSYSEHKGIKTIVQTPVGKGKIACVGSPDHKISYLCAYPNNDYLPKNAIDDFTLEISDNQINKKNGKYFSLDYRLFNSSTKSITITQGDSLLLTTRYKLIDARAALPVSLTDKILLEEKKDPIKKRINLKSNEKDKKVKHFLKNKKILKQ